MLHRGDMPTNLHLDDRLIERVLKAGNHRSKKDAVTAALEEYAERRERIKILDAFGTVEYDPRYDYKRSRRGKRA
jgi:Arc/MetJ family transcription regulator